MTNDLSLLKLGLNHNKPLELARLDAIDTGHQDIQQDQVVFVANLPGEPPRAEHLTLGAGLDPEGSVWCSLGNLSKNRQT